VSTSTTTGVEVEQLTRDVERRLRDFSPFVARVDVVAAGQAPAADRTEPAP